MRGKNVTVYLDADHTERLEHLAKSFNQPKSKIIERAFTEFVANNEHLFVDRDKLYREAMEYLPKDTDDEETLRSKRAHLFQAIQKLKEAP